MKIKRTDYCGCLDKNSIGSRVSLCGWVQRRRDHGGLIFIDLRDRSGIVQIVFDREKCDADVFSLAESLRSEYVIGIKGEVVPRAEETVNPKMPTGEIEVKAELLEVFNASLTPPFYIEDGIDVDENLRLKYRYLDLRRPEMTGNLIIRHRAAMTVREYLDKNGFLEIETPMLIRSTPEGARDFLVPSRTVPGNFFALPQSPQLFKQLLMVSGMERYFQIVRCFRDEDLRADRQPEFTQIDIELAFTDEEEIQAVIEGMIKDLFKVCLGADLALPFPRMTYKEAITRYGTDKPDLRFGLELVDVTDIISNSGFNVFRQAAASGGVVRGLRVPGCASYSRKDMDDLTMMARQWGAKGLAWIAVSEGEVRSPIAKFLGQDELSSLVEKMGAKQGDLLLFVADREKTAAEVLGRLRTLFGQRLSLIPKNRFELVWITEFPLVSYDEEAGRHVANHHPFTSPVEEDIPLMETEPLQVRARAYDLVLNGVEIGGGSIRNHRHDIQEKVFKMLGLSKQQAWEKFGFLLQAFQYGAPPHGGIAFGFDRLVMLLAGQENIRQVIAFPKTGESRDLMTGAPAPVDPEQLRELHLKVTEVSPKKRP